MSFQLSKLSMLYYQQIKTYIWLFPSRKTWALLIIIWVNISISFITYYLPTFFGMTVALKGMDPGVRFDPVGMKIVIKLELVEADKEVPEDKRTSVSSLPLSAPPARGQARYPCLTFKCMLVRMDL